MLESGINGKLGFNMPKFLVPFPQLKEIPQNTY
jgi:hypothetical protein